MIAKKLMIDDWVQFPDRNEKGTVVGIKCDARYLEEYAIITVMDKRGKWFEYNIDDLKLIPLTDEILKSNGFILDSFEYCEGKFWVRNDFGFGMNGYLTVGSGKCWQNVKIEYVHELQHALRLCGIDKEIKLED